MRIIGFIRWRAALVLLLLVGMGLLEGAGLVLLVPLLGAIGLDVQGGALGGLASFAASAFSRLGLTPSLPLVLAVFLGVNAILALLRRHHLILSAALEQDVIRSATTRLYAAIVRMDWLAFSRMRGSDLVVALTSHAERAGLAVSQFLIIASSSVVTAVFIALALRLSMQMTLVIFACGTALLLSLRRRTAAATVIGSSFTDAVKEFQAAVTDDLAGMKTIRGVAGEQRSLSRLEALAERVGVERVRGARHYATGNFWVDFGSLALLSALVLIAVEGFRFDAPALLLLLFLFARIVPRLSSLQHNLHFCASFLPSVQSLADLEVLCAANAESGVAAGAPLRLRKSLTFESIVFRYSVDGPPILDGVNLRIDAGTTVAFVGASGAGKTTCADLLMGLLRPESGVIVVDDVVLGREEMLGWRQSVAYVAQDIFLFHDSIRANLQWAVPGATDAEMWTALNLASAEFVAALPAGLDTIVGDRGVRLSGGERQRIALARALLRKPSLLILDEATSALDSENESRILGAIRRLHGTLTIVIITHRLAAVAAADVIHVLETGRLVESGSWEHLAAMPRGRFRQLSEATVS